MVRRITNEILRVVNGEMYEGKKVDSWLSFWVCVKVEFEA